ncbi:MAG: histidine kinase dimerization/phospho-acceptor domain-containing protein, partial [Bradyrhizobium sp.]
QAFAAHDTWSGITLNWPVDGGGSLPIELAGLPVFDRARNFAGFRGFAVCRDLDALARLAACRRFESEHEAPTPQALCADTVPSESRHGPAAVPPAGPDVVGLAPTGAAAAMADETTPPPALDKAVEPPPNVVQFRPPGEARSPMLTPVENSAFNELARQLSARLDRDNAPSLTPLGGGPIAAIGEPDAPEAPEPSRAPGTSNQPATNPPEWLTQPEPPAEGTSKRDRALLDLLPTGILIYRLDRLLYANPAFLERIGYASLHALEQDGGLDALYVEPGVSAASSTSQAGTPVTIAANQAAAEPAAPTEARLFTIAWDGCSAHALMFVPTASTPAPAPVSPPPPSGGHVDAEDLAAILDTTAEGLLMFDASGNIHACNRSTEALFGQDGNELSRRNLAGLFAPESRRVVLDYLDSVRGAGAASLLEPSRDVLARVGSKGGIMPLSMTIGRTRPDGPHFFAVFRDRSQGGATDGEPREARPPADRAASAKADMPARISHEVRAPLNAIIGFAEVMIDERFGSLGNERYAEYLKDIRASGERVIAIIDDLTELSRIETGKLDLAFANQNLNELVESCVAVMQPQANRERIIIRTSLAHLLPPVVADARALRQVAMNLVGNSIRLANPGGQVIVSTASSDHGEVVLRVRDTGHGLNENEVAAALEPFRNLSPSETASHASSLNLSLTKALVEANRAQFHIRTGERSGTLVEVVFAHALART